jgi:hypothetical protein
MIEEKNAGPLLKDLRKVTAANVAKVFTPLFKRGYDLLGLSGNDMARVLDSSERNIRRWKSGETVPPAANLVLKFLHDEIEREVRKGLGKGLGASGRQRLNSHLNKVAGPLPKRSPSKKAIPLGRVNPNYPTTCTTFWKQMEPALHSVMEAALKKAGVTKESKSGYKGVTRRLYRAAVISAASFLKKKTNPSSEFLQKQGDKAVRRAVAKLANASDSDFNEFQ